MLRNPFLVLSCNALLCAVGTLLMRHGGQGLDFSRGLLHVLVAGKVWLLGMVLCWGAGLTFALVLTRLAVTDAFPFYTAAVYALTMLGGVFVLHEPMTGQKAAGICCVLAGIFLLSRQ